MVVPGGHKVNCSEPWVIIGSFVWTDARGGGPSVSVPRLAPYCPFGGNPDAVFLTLGSTPKNPVGRLNFKAIGQWNDPSIILPQKKRSDAQRLPLRGRRFLYRVGLYISTTRGLIPKVASC